MSERAGILQTLALYCQLCDDGRFDEWADLYTADAEFVVMGRVHVGPLAIKGFIERGQPPERRGKHMCANPVIEIHASGRGASAVTDYVFVARGSDGLLALTSAGRYHDELVSDDDGRWRFCRREIVFMGDDPVASTRRSPEPW